MILGCADINKIFYDVDLNYLEIDFSDYYNPLDTYT